MKNNLNHLVNSLIDKVLEKNPYIKAVNSWRCVGTYKGTALLTIEVVDYCGNELELTIPYNSEEEADD